MSNSSDNWTRTCIIAALIAALLTAVGMLIPSKWSWLPLGMAVCVYIVLQISNPRFWSRRAFSCLIGAWIGMRTIPELVVALASPHFTLNLSSSDVPLTVDLVVGLVAIGLLIHDLHQTGLIAIPRSNAENSSRGRNGIATIQELSAGSNLATLQHVQADVVNVTFATQPEVTSATADALVRAAESAANSNLQNIATFDAEIDRIAQYTKDDKPEIAIELLSTLRRHSWDRLSPRQRYRLLANLGHAHNALEEHEIAARCYIEAKAFQPDDEQARALEAAAHDQLGNASEALRLALGVLTNFPNCALAWAVRIRNTSSEEEVLEVETTIPSIARSSVEVLDALTFRVHSREHVDAAEGWIRQALQQKPNDWQLKERLAVVLLRRYIDIPAHERVDEVTAESDRERLDEAVTVLNALIDRQQDKGLRPKHGRLRFNRAVANGLLGNATEAARDYVEAFQLSGRDPDIGARTAFYLWKIGRADEALDVLGHVALQKQLPKNHWLRANILIERGEPHDLAEARKILETASQLSSKWPAKDRSDIAESFIELELAAGDITRAADRLQLDSGTIEPLPRILLQAKVAFRLGRTEDAIRLANSALLISRDPSDIATADSIARVFEELGLFHDALGVMRAYVVEGHWSPLTRRVLSLAQKAQDDRTILTLCAALRGRGVFDQRCLQLELATLERYHAYSEAVAILDSASVQISEETVKQLLNLHRLRLGVILANEKLLVTDLALLPSPASLNAEVLCFVTNLLVAAGDRPAAAEFAYRAIRQLPGEPEAHKAMVSAVGIGDDHVHEFGICDVAAIGCAIRYRIQGDDSERWCVLEDDAMGGQLVTEYWPDSSIAKELVGKKVGEQFFIRKDGVQDLLATITAITHKYVFRRVDSITHWEERFPDNFFVRSMHLEKDECGHPDIAVIFRQLDRQQEQTDNLFGMYGQHVVPITTVADVSGRLIVEAMGHISQRRDVWFRCCRGTDDERITSWKILERSATVVLDPVALSTLYLTGIFRHIPTVVPLSLTATEGAFVLFRELRERDRHEGRGKAWTGKRGSQYYFHEWSDEDRQRSQESIAEFMTWVNDNVKLISGLALVELDAETREKLIDLFDEGVAESVATAKQMNAPLWTDDFAIGEIARSECGVQRIWSDVLLRFWGDRQLLKAETVFECLLHLLSMRFEFTPLYPPMVTEAGRAAGWYIDRPPLDTVCEWFGRPERHPEGLLQLLAQAVPMVWRDAPLYEQRTQVVHAIASNVLRHPNGRELLDAMLRNMDALFGLDVLGAAKCGQMIQRAIDQSQAGRLILP